MSATIKRGIVFVAAGLLLALCDRWPSTLTVQGSYTSKAHIFDHLFLLWFFKQFVQCLLLPLWILIERNIFGFGRLMHGQEQPQRNNPLALAAENQNAQPNLAGGNRNDAANNPEPDRANNQAQLGRNRRKIKKPSALIYFPAAIFSQSSILLLYFGVKLTYSSSFIMLKGTAALFTALLSLAFLAQQLAFYVWFGVIMATLGFVVAGLSDYVHDVPNGYEKYGIAAGDLLIAMSQIMFATQITYEQRFIKKHSIHPMRFLGVEGIYGLIFSLFFVLLFNFSDMVQYSILPNGKLEDIYDAFHQLRNSPQCAVSFLGSILFYNLYTYLGMFLIRDLGALSRIMTETLIWALYWVIAVAVGWDKFFVSQIPGLVAIPLGVLIYNHIVPIPFGSCGGRPNEGNGNAGEGNPEQIINDNAQAVDDDVPLLNPEDRQAIEEVRRRGPRQQNADVEILNVN